jgi:hypothetical protein
MDDKTIIAVTSKPIGLLGIRSPVIRTKENIILVSNNDSMEEVTKSEYEELLEKEALYALPAAISTYQSDFGIIYVNFNSVIMFAPASLISYLSLSWTSIKSKVYDPHMGCCWWTHSKKFQKNFFDRLSDLCLKIIWDNKKDSSNEVHGYNLDTLAEMCYMSHTFSSANESQRIKVFGMLDGLGKLNTGSMTTAKIDKLIESWSLSSTQLAEVRKESDKWVNGK